MLKFMSMLQVPPKEGRGHPGLPCLDQKRRWRLSTKTRVMVALLIVMLIRLSWFAMAEMHPAHQNQMYGFPSELNTFLKRGQSPEITLSVKTEIEGSKSGVTKEEASKNASPTSVLVTALKKPVADRKGTKNSNTHPKDFSIIEQHARVETQSNTKHNKGNTRSFQRSIELEASVERVITMLPGEMNMRDLLRPVEGTGKEKLREMGLRTRSYREFFQAWEDLHMTTDADGITHIRDDIVQYLTRLGKSPESTSPSRNIFSSMSTAQIVRGYETYKYFLAKFGQLLFPYTSPFFPDHMTLHLQFKTAGRGIVLTAGDDQAHFLMTTIYSFRKLGCTLPIEVMYLGDSDLSEDYRAELESMEGVVTRDVSQMVNDEGWKLAGWAIKPFAMLFSSFREVIFIDADSAFFQNPEVLFDDPSYEKNGALFFKDRLFMPESKKRWVQQVLPKPFSAQIKQNRFWTGESAHMQESGVVVVDKWKHFLAMLLVTRMNGPDRDGDESNGKIGVYDMVYGDKETFWLGWELSGDFKYSFHQGDAGTMGVVSQTKATDTVPASEDHVLDVDSMNHPEDSDSAKLTETNFTICAPQLLHLDLGGKPLWFNGWVLDNKFADKSHKQFAEFEDYVVEPHNGEGDDAWELQQDNQCCLTTHPGLRFRFNEAEKETLHMIIRRAKEVLALVLS